MGAELGGAREGAGGARSVGRSCAQRNLGGGPPRVLDAPPGKRRPRGRRREGPGLQTREQDDARAGEGRQPLLGLVQEDLSLAVPPTASARKAPPVAPPAASLRGVL